MKAKGYSLWLMPEEERHGELAALLKILAKEYRSPLFEPHVTLIGGIVLSEEMVIIRSQQLALGQKSFSVTLQTVNYQDYYFRALFVKAEKTQPLLALHNRAKKIFEMQEIPSYMPHLSLLYGNYSQVIKEQIIEAIGKNQAMDFAVNTIHLFKTDGEVSAWYKVQEFPLG